MFGNFGKKDFSTYQQNQKSFFLNSIWSVNVLFIDGKSFFKTAVYALLLLCENLVFLLTVVEVCLINIYFCLLKPPNCFINFKRRFLWLDLWWLLWAVWLCFGFTVKIQYSNDFSNFTQIKTSDLALGLSKSISFVPKCGYLWFTCGNSFKWHALVKFKKKSFE